MKKLFALVLSLALVVAFAVPALATGWASLEPAPVYKEISIAVYGLQVVANTSKVGELYEELKTPYPVVKGTELHFLVELTVPYGNLTAATKALIKEKGLDVVIDTTNMTINTTKSKLVGGGAASVNADKDVITETYTNPAYDTKTVVFSYEVWANANSDKEAKVVATAGFYNKWESGHMAIFNAKGEKAYDVWTNGSEFSVKGSKGMVTFPVTDGKINTKGIKVYIGDDTTAYILTNGYQANMKIGFINNDQFATGTTAEKLEAVYKDVFGFLGFEFAECDYMTEAHFVKYFGTIGEISASYTWNAGSVIVNPVNPTLPQTGDNASIIGFAMIVVAMVAAAVVTFKKVRA